MKEEEKMATIYEFIRRLRRNRKTGNEIAHALIKNYHLVLLDEVAVVMQVVGYTTSLTHDKRNKADILRVSDKPKNNKLRRPPTPPLCENCPFNKRGEN